MSNGLPTLSGKEVVQILIHLGYTVARVKGSHHVMKKPGAGCTVISVPVHGNRALARGTLRAIVRASGVSLDQFRDAAS